MSYLYQIFIDGDESKPVDSGFGEMDELPKVGDTLLITHTPNHPQHRVVRVVDTTNAKRNGDMTPRCDIWVESNGRPNLGTI